MTKKFIPITSAHVREARKLIASRERWTRHVGAVDARGEEVQPRSPKATCWCASGAIAKVSGNASWVVVADYLSSRLDRAHLYSINDSRGHKAVLKEMTIIARLLDKGTSS